MTYTKLVATTVALAAVLAAPAYADGHMEKKSSDPATVEMTTETEVEMTTETDVEMDMKAPEAVVVKSMTTEEVETTASDMMKSSETVMESSEMKMMDTSENVVVEEDVTVQTTTTLKTDMEEMATEKAMDAVKTETAPMTKKAKKMAKDKMKSEAKTMAKTKMKSEGKAMMATEGEAMMETAGEILQSGEEVTAPADKELMMSEGDVEPKAVVVATEGEMALEGKTIVVPGSSDTVTTVTCPEGTTAQADMTCMITGDFVEE